MGLVMVVTIWVLADLYYAKTPETMGLQADGGTAGTVAASVTSPSAVVLNGRELWRDWRFRTLALGMALGLFAQVGLLAHLFSLLVPALGAGYAGLAAGLATASAIVGRTLFGWLMPVGADRRLFACASYGVQIAGVVAFLLAGGASLPLLLVGVVLFGFGIGNATSLPPLIAQVEFAKEDAARVVPAIVATAQATYAFAPAFFGIVRELAPLWAWPETAAPLVFLLVIAIKAIAIAALLAGRRARLSR
jgi:MFS family permease